MEFTINIIDNQKLVELWDSLKPLIYESFKSARFNSGYTSHDVLLETETEIFVYKDLDTKHILAFNLANNVIGGLLCIYGDTILHTTECEVGWFFTTPNLSSREKVIVGDEILKSTHSLAKRLGYDKIVTEIGTKEGEKFLSKRFGYYYSPLSQKKNRWIKNLD